MTPGGPFVTEPWIGPCVAVWESADPLTAIPGKISQPSSGGAAVAGMPIPAIAAAATIPNRAENEGSLPQASEELVVAGHEHDAPGGLLQTEDHRSRDR